MPDDLNQKSLEGLAKLEDEVATQRARLIAVSRQPRLTEDEFADLKRSIRASVEAQRLIDIEVAEKRRKRRAAEPWAFSLKKACRVAVFFVTHAVLASLVIVLLTLVNDLLTWLGSPKLFHRVDLAYVFDFMDLVTLCVFGFFASAEAVAVFKD